MRNEDGNARNAGRRRARMAMASRWLLALAIAGSALAVGTVHTITLCIVTAVLAAAAVLAWWDAEPMRARSSATILLFTGIGLTAYTALQCVPMPIGWLAALAPHNADVWSRALSPLHEPGPTWAPISLDPIATRVEVLKGVAYLLAFVTALRVARRKEGVAFLGGVIVVTATALALAAILHPAFGARRLFGVFEPGPEISERHIAPLLNPNNLAGYLNIGICISLAALFAVDLKVPRAIVGAGVLFLSAVQLWVASRGGVLSMVLGALVVIFFAYTNRSKKRSGGEHLPLLLGLVALAGAMMMALGSEGVEGELLETNVSKIQLFAQAMRMVGSYPVFGVGRGAFESTFPAFREALSPAEGPIRFVTFTHPENVVAQWTIEWGVPVAAAALLFIIWSLRPTSVLARSTTVAGSWAALSAVALQNLGDLSSEIPGVVLTLVTCTAAVVAGSPGERSRWRGELWAAAPRFVAGACAVGWAVALVACIPALAHKVAEDDKTLYDAAVDHPQKLSELEAQAHAAMLRHPSEPYIPFVVGFRAAKDRAPESIAWLGATLDRAKIYGPAHFVLARVIGARAPAQARLEYRLAVEQAPELIGPALSEAPFLIGTYWDALEVVPSDQGLGVRVMDALAIALADRLPATRARLDAELLARSPDASGAADRLAQDAVEDLETVDGAPWCLGDARRTCVRTALDLAARARSLAPTRCIGHVLYARAVSLSGDSSRALADLEAAADTVVDRGTCLQALARAASKANNSAVTVSALDKLFHAGCGIPAECTQNMIFVAQQEEQLGSGAKALAAYKRAYEEDPADDNVLAQMARLAGSAGLHIEAYDYYSKLAKKHPGEHQWELRAASEREASLMQSL